MRITNMRTKSTMQLPLVTLLMSQVGYIVNVHCWRSSPYAKETGERNRSTLRL